MAYFLLSSDLSPASAACAAEALSSLSSVAASWAGGLGSGSIGGAPIGLGLLAKDSHGHPNSRIKIILKQAPHTPYAVQNTIRTRLLPGPWAPSDDGPPAPCDLHRAFAAAATLAAAAAALGGGGDTNSNNKTHHSSVFILAPSFECADVEAVRRFAQQACERDGAFVRLVAFSAPGGGGEGATHHHHQASSSSSSAAARHTAWLCQRLGTPRVSYDSVDLALLGGAPGAAECLAQAFARDLLLPPSRQGVPLPVRLLLPPRKDDDDASPPSAPPPLAIDFCHAPHLLLLPPFQNASPLPGAPDVVAAPAAAPPPPPPGQAGDAELHPHPPRLLAFGARCAVRLRGGAAAAAAFVAGGGGGESAAAPIVLRCEAVVPRARVAPETLVGGPWLLAPAGAAVAAQSPFPRPVLTVVEGGGGGEAAAAEAGGGNGGALEVEMACDDDDDDEDGGGGESGGGGASAGAAASDAAAAAGAGAAAAALAVRLAAGGLVLLASSRSPAIGSGSGGSGLDLLPAAMAPAVYCLEPASAGGGALVARRVAPREALVPLPPCMAPPPSFSAAGDDGGAAEAAAGVAAAVGRALEGLLEPRGAAEEGDGGAAEGGESVALPTSGLHEFVERLLWRERAGAVRLLAAPPLLPAVAPASAPACAAAAPAAAAAAAAPPPAAAAQEQQQQQPPRPGTTTFTAPPRRASKRIGALPLGPASGRAPG